MFSTIVAVLLISQVSGHGYISNPPAQFLDTSIKTKYNSITNENIDPAFAGLKWDDSPDNNVKTFTAAFKKSNFTSLKNMFDYAKVDCGNSRVDISRVDVSAMNSMSWQNDEYKEGFISSHSGPCEAWLDDERVFQNDDCRSAYTNYPAVLPIDYSKCKGSCLLEFYWCAVHEPNWQLYKQCVPLMNSNNKTSSGITTSESATSESATSESATSNYSITVDGNNCVCKIV